MKISAYFTKKFQNCTKSKLSDLFAIFGTWIYKFETHISLVISSDCAKTVIIKNKKRGKPFHMPYFLNSYWPFVIF